GIVGDNVHCQDGGCESIISANEALLAQAGFGAVNIQLIGKFTPTGDVAGWSELAAPFVGHDFNESWICDETNGCTLTVDFSGLNLDWQIVKLIAKDGKVTNALGGDGDFLRTNALQP